MMASIRWLPGSTSMVSEVTPRARAPAISARISAEPTPWPCHASATTTPASAARAPRRAALVHGHGVPDDHAVPDRDHHVGAAVAAGHRAEHPGVRRDRGEEPQVPGLRGQSREEVSERARVRRARRPDHGGDGNGPPRLSSEHELSILRIAESVKQT